MKALFIILALFSSLGTQPIENKPTEDHPIYVSLSEIEYKEKQKSLEIALRIFADDLEDAIEKRTGKDIEIATDKETQDANQAILAYIKEHFILRVNGKSVQYRLLGKETADKDLFAIWVYLEVKKVSRVKEIELENTLLLEVLDGQQNMVNFKTGESLRKFVCRKGYEKAVLYKK